MWLLQHLEWQASRDQHREEKQVEDTREMASHLILLAKTQSVPWVSIRKCKTGPSGTRIVAPFGHRADDSPEGQGNQIAKELLMTDIRSPTLLYLKGFLFLLVGCLAGGILLAENPSWRAAILLGLTVWAFCRAYYFAFYVIEHYIDPSYKFAGLWSAAWYVGRQFFATSSGNPPENTR